MGRQSSSDSSVVHLSFVRFRPSSDGSRQMDGDSSDRQIAFRQIASIVHGRPVRGPSVVHGRPVHGSSVVHGRPVRGASVGK